jgi:bifunctional UDP-N-acetylglucosamine pyrophosphorylase/glucosamine-1-phosphate N-acetyltransferase
MSGKRAAIVLAAGKGKRMKSDIPKVLHELDGRPLIKIVLETLAGAELDRTVVVIGFKGEMVREALTDYSVEFAWQREQLGTGHAVQVTRDIMADFDGTTLVALGDMPLLTVDSVRRLFEVHERTGAAATCLSAVLDDPTGYGRIVREDDGEMLAEIVEHKDASEDVLRINEVNTGLFCFDNRRLFEALAEVRNDNVQAEYYLPDTIKIMRSRGLPVAVVTAEDPREGLGVNSAQQLEQLKRQSVK